MWFGNTKHKPGKVYQISKKHCDYGQFRVQESHLIGWFTFPVLQVQIHINCDILSAIYFMSIGDSVRLCL